MFWHSLFCLEVGSLSKWVQRDVKFPTQDMASPFLTFCETNNLDFAVLIFCRDTSQKHVSMLSIVLACFFETPPRG